MILGAVLAIIGTFLPWASAGGESGNGYDDYFYRLWEFYLCYCEGGFLERAIGTAQLLLAKPGARRKPLYVASSASAETR